MTKKMKVLAAIGLFLIVLTGARIVWTIAFDYRSDAPRAVNGVLDLRDWDVNGGKTITLDGEWAFYPYTWLAGNEATPEAQTRDFQYIEVPGNWNDILGSPHGYGSYRLTILVNPDHDPSYSIRVSSARSASELYVDGRLLAKSGQPASSEEDYTARNFPYSASFTTNGSGKIDVVVQAANFTDDRSSGIVRALKFGTEEAVSRETRLSTAMQQVAAIALLAHAIYALILFGMGYRDKKLLFFALLLVVAVLVILIAGDDKILRYWLPMNLEQSMAFISIISVFGSIALYKCVMDWLPGFWRVKGFRVFIAVCGACLLSRLFLSAPIFQAINYVFMLFISIVVVMASMNMVRAAAKGIRDNMLLLMSLIAFASNFIWWGIYLLTGSKVVYYPFDLITATVCFASIWFKRYLQMHAETAKLAVKLQNADRRKDEFLANTSHELRNPLHGILNMAQAVLERERPAISVKSIKDLELVQSVGRRMSLMLNDLLDVMKLKESGIKSDPRSFYLQSVAAGVLDMLHFMTEGKPVRLKNEIPDNFPQVFADENRVIQILFNLVHNGVKYTDEGEVAVRGHVKNGRAYIVVADTGVGMDAETAQRVFDPYEQGAHGGAAADGGFGLGLSISRQLAELHGGTLHVRSVPGEGSAFSFSLPLAEPSSEVGETTGTAEAAAAIEATSAAYGTSLAEAMSAASAAEAEERQLEPAASNDRSRILIVDDDPLNLNVLMNMLSPEQYEMIALTSGQEAVAALDLQEWDLVISDVMMPRMSGYELSRTIRDRYSITELPILLLTARSRPEDIESGFLAGANDYVTKPVDALELRSRVQALTAVKKSVRERLRMEAAWLQAQIQPHFLFNTLTSVAVLSEIDSGRMRALLEAFGSFLRGKFKMQNLDELVPLEYELNLVRSYLAIEQERYEDRLQVVWEIDDCGLLLIPPLTIQPLVENAIKHGLMKRMSGGSIRIRVSERERDVEISIEDDGAGMEAQIIQAILGGRMERAPGIGLTNTNQRLKRHLGKGLQITSAPGAGTRVSFVVNK